MTWYTIIATITKLTELDEFTVSTCAKVLECTFELTASNRYRSSALQAPFDYAELILGSDKTIFALTLKDNSAREEYVLRVSGLGKPIDVDVVSSPIADKNASKTNLDWDRKYSLCYEFGDRRVWFGIEVAGSQKKLVTVSIHKQH